MHKADLYGKTLACSCGKTHRIQPREVIYAEDAPAALAAACETVTPGRRVAVLTDARTREAAGAEVARAFAKAGWQVNELLLADPAPGRSPVCDDHTRSALEPRLGEADLLCPVGAGVLSDMGKWIALERDLPYVCFATAASMNGYASANIAPTIAGVKRLVYGRAPVVVASRPSVLIEAPYELTASGLGDVLAKSISSADWYANHVLFGDFFCREATALIEEIEPLYLDRPGDLPARRPDAIEAVFSALLLTGVAMTMADTSFPASGGEHLISHSLDMMSSVDGAAHDLHGRQVGLGTIIASELYRRVLATDSPSLPEPTGGTDPALWGPIAPEVAKEYVQKLPRLHQARRLLADADRWDRLREALGAMVRPPERIRDCLAQAGAACRCEHIGCDRDRLRTALTHAHEIRSRFTILDLARLAGVLPAAAGKIVEQWA